MGVPFAKSRPTVTVEENQARGIGKRGKRRAQGSRAEYERRYRRNCTRVSLGLRHEFLQLGYQLADLLRVLSDAAELLLVEVRSNLFAQEDLRDHIADVRGSGAALCNAITKLRRLDLPRRSLDYTSSSASYSDLCARGYSQQNKRGIMIAALTR